MKRASSYSIPNAARVGGALLSLTVLLAPVYAYAFGEAEIDAQNWWQTKREAKLQEFREFPNGPYLGHFLVRGPFGGFTGTGWGTSNFLKQQRLGFALASGIRWQLDGRYQQIPHTFSLIARSPFVQTGSGVFSLSDSLQRANQENPSATFISTMNAALAVAPGMPLEHRTDIKRLRLRVRPDRGWQVALAGEQRARVGTKAYGMSFGFSNANEVVEPIHQRMNDVSLTANYHRDRVMFRTLIGYSNFDNRVDALVVDNPRRYTDSPTAGSSRGRIDLYPDNSSVRGQVDLSLTLPSRTLFNGSFSVARMRQDDDWLPFTINSAIAQSSLDSLYGSVTARSTGATAVRWAQTSRLSHRFTNGIKGDAHLRWQRYDNQTEVFPFRGVVQYDQSLVRDTVGFVNHPFGNEQLTTGSDWNVRVTDQLSLGAGYDHKWRHHSLREVERDQENLVHARLALDTESGLYAAGGWTYGARRLDEFELAEYRREDAPDTVFLENPALRRFDVADRNRHDANAEVGWVLNDRVDVSINGQLTDNDYGKSTYGLQSDQRWTLLGQVTTRPTLGWDLSGGYGFGRGDTDQRSQERGTTAIPITTANPDSGNVWTARIRDRNDFGFVQSTWRVVPHTFTVTTSYWVSRDQAKYRLNNQTVTAVNLPDTYYLRQEGRLEGRYRLSDGTELIGRYGYDTWKVNDFAAKDIPLLGVASNAAVAIYLGASLQNYTAHSVSFAISRKF